MEKSEPVKAVFTLRLRPVIILIMCAGHKTIRCCIDLTVHHHELCTITITVESLREEAAISGIEDAFWLRMRTRSG